MLNIFSRRWTPVLRAEEDAHSEEGLLDGGTKRVEKNKCGGLTARTVFILVNIAISLAAVGAVGLHVGFGRSCVFNLQDDVVFPGLGLDSKLKPDKKSRWSANETDSIYLQPPSPEVDAAWDELTLDRFEMTTITGEQARTLGRDVNAISKVPEDWGLGTDRYFAQVQVFHLIHCLDELRKQIHYDHYHLPKLGKTPPPEFTNHKKHCMHMLLENLLCQSSSDIITHNWRETYDVPLADFNPPRECRNYDALREWETRNAIPDYRRKWAKLQVPSDAVVLPAPTPRLY